MTTLDALLKRYEVSRMINLGVLASSQSVYCLFMAGCSDYIDVFKYLLTHIPSFNVNNNMGEGHYMQSAFMFELRESNKLKTNDKIVAFILDDMIERNDSDRPHELWMPSDVRLDRDLVEILKFESKLHLEVRVEAIL